jgi:hypothetical protein
MKRNPMRRDWKRDPHCFVWHFRVAKSRTRAVGAEAKRKASAQYVIYVKAAECVLLIIVERHVRPRTLPAERFRGREWHLLKHESSDFNCLMKVKRYKYIRLLARADHFRLSALAFFNWFAAIIDLNVYLLRILTLPFKTRRELFDLYLCGNYILHFGGGDGEKGGRQVIEFYISCHSSSGVGNLHLANCVYLANN